ncbi:hypothetical protein BN1723_012789 [Verticillium longisporum]|uniref:Major facilitator superfamily (MFS) profile domain-containing protein n=1 Tax=Verticillium longisporum TaxID=100787 RepID=A0A0G4LLF8_VERLO|nr:hypothetical protein BN1723_012789 [Verticillium longisporum]
MGASRSKSKRTTTYNRLVTVAVAFGSLTYGHCSSVIGSTIGQPGWSEFFDLPLQGEPGYASKTTDAIATPNGIYSAGGAIGTLFIIMFQAGRILAGIGIGILVTVCPMYMGELSPPEKRGWLVGHHPIFLVFGYMLSGWLGYACYFATARNPEFAWGGSRCSPRWLLQKGKTEKAWKVVQNLRKSDDDPHDIAAREEIYQVREQIVLDAAKLKAIGCTPWTAVIKKKSYRKRMAIGFLTQWGAEFAGPLIINDYSVILYTNLGQTGSMPLLLSALWLTTAGVIYNPLGAWLHDKVNSRRWMFIVGLFGCLITTSGFAACIAEFSGTSNQAGNAAGVFLVFLYLAFQGALCDTTMYLYVAEIFPTEIRPIGMGFSLFGQFTSTTILLQTAPIGIVNVGWKYYLVIIVWCIFLIPMVYLFFPETAKLSLEEISARFGDDVAVRITDVSDDQRKELDDFLKTTDVVHMEARVDEKKARVGNEDITTMA